jgi:BirA family biotin operon repressor/biotin-[acetyl-CoA-carboxylase] ligase
VSILVRPKVPQERLGWLPLLAGVAAQKAVHRIADVDVSLKWPNDLIVPGDDSGDGYGAGRKLGGILCQRGLSDKSADKDGAEGDKLALGGPDADKPLGDKPLADKPLGEGGPAADTDGVAEPAAVVVGIGLNVTLRTSELPAPHATSVALAGGSVTDRDTLLRALLRDFGSCYASWAAADGDPEASGLAAAYREACSTLGTPVRAEMPGGAVVSGQADAIDGEGRLVVLDAAGDRMPIGAGDVVHLR